MSTVRALYSRADYMQLPEGFPAQLIEGCLVKQASPKFGHQRIVLRLGAMLEGLVGDRRVAIAPADVHVDEFNIYQPDVCVTHLELDDTADDIGIPMIAIEVLSSSTASYDRAVKRIRLLDAGVEEFWIIDPRGQTVEVFDQLRYRDVPRRALRNESITSHVLPSFAIELATLFNPRPPSP